MSATTKKNVMTKHNTLNYLCQYLAIEQTGHKQYLLNASYCQFWSLDKLAAIQKAYSEEETAHSSRLMQRILFLGGNPELADARQITAQLNVETQLQQDQNLLVVAIDLLREAVTQAEAEKDFVSRDLFAEMLADEETHLHWVQTQLKQITLLGLENYLQSQL